MAKHKGLGVALGSGRLGESGWGDFAGRVAGVAGPARGADLTEAMKEGMNGARGMKEGMNAARGMKEGMNEGGDE